jgi:hypothetical protein
MTQPLNITARHNNDKRKTPVLRGTAHLYMESLKHRKITDQNWSLNATAFTSKTRLEKL